MVCIDDHSRFTWLFLLKNKSEVTNCIKNLCVLIERQFGDAVKGLRADNATDFLNRELSDFFKSKGIIHQTSCPYTPQQNGLAERKIGDIVDKARTLLIQSSAPLNLWGFAVMTSSHLINRLPSRILNLQSPIEILETFYPYVRLKTSLAIKPFGCITYVYNPLHRLNKWSSKSLICVFLGYSPNQKGYKLYHPVTRKYVVSKDVAFDEKVFYYTSPRHESLRDLNYLRKLDDLVPQAAEFDSDPYYPIQDSDLSPELVGLPSPVTEPDRDSIDSSQVQLPQRDLPESQGIPSEHPPPQDLCLSGPSSPVSKSPSNSTPSPVPSVTKSPPNPNQGDWSIALRKGTRSCVKPRPHNLAHYLTFHKVSPEYKTFLLHLRESFIPKSPREALQIPQWKKAMDEEMKALLLNDTWEIVPLPKGKYCRWVFTLKCTHNAGNKPKARLVAKGFT